MKKMMFTFAFMALVTMAFFHVTLAVTIPETSGSKIENNDNPVSDGANNGKESESSESSGSQFRCKPHQRFFDRCNRCRCNGSGTSASCTNKGCRLNSEGKWI